MIRTVIIDDDPKNIKILKGLIEEFCPELSMVGDADNAKSGAELIRSVKPQLVFLDIEMPYGNGFDMLKSMMPIDFEVIFVTAFDTYMLQAFRYAALDYLLKPVNIEELKNAVATARKRIDTPTVNEQLSLLMENMKRGNQGMEKIAIPSQDGYLFVPLTDIVRCEAKGSYTEIYLSGNKGKLVVSKLLREYEAVLPPDLFFRVHNSHIININYIKKYNRGRGGFIELDNGFTIEVAVRRKEEFLKRFGLGS
jgi:two-component system, LytTR family, response regulator